MIVIQIYANDVIDLNDFDFYIHIVQILFRNLINVQMNFSRDQINDRMDHQRATIAGQAPVSYSILAPGGMNPACNRQCDNTILIRDAKTPEANLTIGNNFIKLN